MSVFKYFMKPERSRIVLCHAMSLCACRVGEGLLPECSIGGKPGMKTAGYNHWTGLVD